MKFIPTFIHQTLPRSLSTSLSPLHNQPCKCTHTPPTPSVSRRILFQLLLPLPFLPIPTFANPTLPSQLPPSTLDSLKSQSRANTKISSPLSQTFSKARRAAAAGDLDTAFTLYTDLTQSAPTFAPAFSNRANILVSRHLFSDALNDYSTALSLAPVDSDAWVVYVNRGCVYLAMDDPTLALQDMNFAYDLAGDNAVVLSNRATVYEQLQKWDAALRDYQKALKSNDVQPFWLRYAMVLFQRNKVSEAMSILNRVRLKFDVEDVHALSAVLLFEQGDLAQAEAEWAKVDRPRSFENVTFLKNDRKWPPRAVDTMVTFRGGTQVGA